MARTCGHTPAAERAVARFSRLGEHGAVWVVIGLAGGLAQPGRRHEWSRARRAIGATYVANTTIKLLVRRPRPDLPGLAPLTGTPTGLGFPSAHTATGFAGALAYSRLGVPAPALYGLASALAYSRLYLGVHHPTDIIAGALLGTAVAALMSRPVPPAGLAPA